VTVIYRTVKKKYDVKKLKRSGKRSKISISFGIMRT